MILIPVPETHTEPTRCGDGIAYLPDITVFFFITATLTEKAGGPRRGRGAAGFFGRTTGSRGLRPQWDMICAALDDSIETY